MYIPENLRIKSQQEIYDFIDEFSFATIISSDLEATHLPLVMKSGDFQYLYGHFAKANNHWRKIEGTEVLVIFTSPHSYISPAWYKTAPAVPTWNYGAVHVKGILRATTEFDTIQAINLMMSKYDPNVELDDKFVSSLVKSIVGFKLEILSIEGKEKLGQHRSTDDQLGVYEALKNHSGYEQQQLANYMLKRKLGIGAS